MYVAPKNRDKAKKIHCHEVPPYYLKKLKTATAATIRKEPPKNKIRFVIQAKLTNESMRGLWCVSVVFAVFIGFVLGVKYH